MSVWYWHITSSIASAAAFCLLSRDIRINHTLSLMHDTRTSTTYCCTRTAIRCCSTAVLLYLTAASYWCYSLAVAVLKVNGCGEGRGFDAVTGDGAVTSYGCACRPQLHGRAHCKLAATCDLQQSTWLLAPWTIPCSSTTASGICSWYVSSRRHTQQQAQQSTLF